MVLIGGADQSEVALIGNSKDDATIFALKEIALVMIVELLGHDMAATDQTHPFAGVAFDLVLDDVANPGAASVDQHACLMHLFHAAVAVPCGHLPDAAVPTGRDDLGAGHDPRAAFFSVAGIEHNQTAVFDPAVGIFKRFGETILKGGAFGTGF